MADEGTNLKLQQSLDALPVEEREAVNAIWSNFSSSSHPRRALILRGLLTMCCFSQLSLLTEQLSHLIRLDPFSVLPHEVTLKILGYLDATSLCRAAQVSRKWKALADDDALWRGICEQHIGQKCLKCGWGLPVLEKRRPYRCSPCPSSTLTSSPSNPSKRSHDSELPERPLKRLKSDLPAFLTHHHPYDIQPPTADQEPPSTASLLESDPTEDESRLNSVTRPWKAVYSERLTIERNWRRGRCTVRTLEGHGDGVMCLQFNENLAQPNFPVLITGSYDRTIRVWNMETGVELHCLKGHTRAVRALQFDEIQLITGSMDHTLRVWDWRRGKCIKTLTGHTAGVVCLNFDSNVLASGSVDSTIKVWNLRSGGAFTLRGHNDWVNAVQLWDSDSGQTRTPPVTPSGRACSAEIDPGKMLFSASDDGTIRLWDLTLKSCIRQFTGHVGQVQSLRLLLTDTGCEDKNEGSSADEMDVVPEPTEKRLPMLISGSLDNTIRMWNIETGKVERTFFGHIEGVWAVASDKLRLVSGSHDRTIKVWNRDENKCVTTLVGHRAAVTCLALAEDKIVSGSDDGDVKIWSFAS